MESASVSDRCHTLRPPRTILEHLSQLQAVCEVPGPEHPGSLLASVKSCVARKTPLLQQDERVPVLYTDVPEGNQVWSSSASLYQAGSPPVPQHMEFVGTLMLSDTVGHVPARIYYHDEQKTVFAIVHDANLHALEVELREECRLSGGGACPVMDYTPLRTKGASVLPSFLRSATESYYLVREGIAPFLAMRSPDSTTDLSGIVLDKGSASVFASKMNDAPASKFTTVFTKSCAPPPVYQAKLSAQEAHVAGGDIVHSLVSAIVGCRLKETSRDVDSEAETSVLTPSCSHRWTVRPVLQLSVRAFRAKVQVARTLYGARAVADKEVCLLTNMLDVARAISKELLSGSDDLLLGHFLSERFRNSVSASMKADVLQAIAESLDARCSLAFVTLATGGGGELAPPLLLAHGGHVVESTAEHLARLLDGGHSAVIKFSPMENRVRQVGVKGVARSALRLSEAFRTSVVSSLIHDSRMEVVARPAPVVAVVGANGSSEPVARERDPECAALDAALLQLDTKRRRVEERVKLPEPCVAPGTIRS